MSGGTDCLSLHPTSFQQRAFFFGCCPLFLNETLTFDVQHQDQITTRDYFTVGEKNSIWPHVQIPLHCSFTKTKIIIKTRLGTSYRPIKELWKITGPEKKIIKTSISVVKLSKNATNHVIKSRGRIWLWIELLTCKLFLGIPKMERKTLKKKTLSISPHKKVLCGWIFTQIPSQAFGSALRRFQINWG